MLRACSIVFGLAAAAFSAAAHAQAKNPTDVLYVVTYIEVMPSSVDRATAALREYREAAGHEPGRLRLDVLQQRDRENHFAIVEAWTNQAALDAHRQAPSVTQRRDRLEPVQIAPADERLLKGFSVGSIAPLTGAGGAVYVLTHADALPPANRATDALTPLADASRGESGHLRFEVLQQPNRLNHFTVVEVWKDRKAHDAHIAAPHTRRFRGEFQAITGSLYDERLYRLLN